MSRLLRVVPVLGILAALALTPAHAVDCSATLQSLIDATPSGGTLLVPACTYHELVTVSKPLTLDGQNQATIEGDSRTNWIAIQSSNVTIQNFTMHGGAEQDGQGGIANWTTGITNIVVSHNTLWGTPNGAGVGLGQTTNSKIVNNVVHDAGQMGINSVGNSGLLVQGNHLYHNNDANIDPGYAAGGLHAVGNTSTQILNNEIDHNAGPGIWCDIGCNGVTIANNNVHDQGFNAIFYEISSNGDIYGNTVSNVALASDSWGCIISSSSGDTNIHDNTCNAAPAILALLDNRPDTPADAGHNVKMVNNRVLNLVPDPSQANLRALRSPGFAHCGSTPLS